MSHDTVWSGEDLRMSVVSRKEKVLLEEALVCFNKFRICSLKMGTILANEKLLCGAGSST